MKIIALGGAGDVGSRAVEMLAQADDVDHITIADRDVTRAEKVAQGVGANPQVRIVTRHVDAADHAGLVAAIEGHDLAVSAIGPYFRFETGLVAACLEADVDYVSVCDEWDATEAVFAQFAHRATEQGRTVVVGLGTSPGMTNVGVRFLADQLDRVRRADVYVYQPLDAGGGEAVMRHMLHIMTGDVALWRDGRRVFVPACGESRTVEFPRFGPVQLWTMGHAEPVTLPRYFEEIDEVNFFMGYGRGALGFVLPARLGLFRFPRIANGLVRGLVAIERRSAGPPADGAVRLDVWGTLHGREEHRVLCGTGQMREATGVSLAIGALMVARGELTVGAGGVFAPEGCLPAASFIQAMRQAGITAYTDLEMTQPI